MPFYHHVQASRTDAYAAVRWVKVAWLASLTRAPNPASVRSAAMNALLAIDDEDPRRLATCLRMIEHDERTARPTRDLAGSAARAVEGA